MKEEGTKKKKMKQGSTVVSKQITKFVFSDRLLVWLNIYCCRPSLPTTQIIQMEDPADFVPTVIPQQRRISTPRLTPIERIRSPVQNKEQRPTSAAKRPDSSLGQIPVTIR